MQRSTERLLRIIMKMKSKSNNQSFGKIIYIVIGIFLSFLIIFGFFFTLMLGIIIGGGSDSVMDGNVAVIPVVGVITTEEINSFSGGDSASSRVIAKQIEQASENDRIKAIIIDINSPGGLAVQVPLLMSMLHRPPSQ